MTPGGCELELIPETLEKEPEMRAESHTPLSVSKHAKAMHHRGNFAAARPATSHNPHTRHQHEGANAGKAGSVLLGVILIAQLMVILDITAVNIAMPSIANDLQLSGSSISWTITSYSLIFGSLLLFGGRAADLLGRRRMFVIGLGVFAAASFASALAGTAGALFAARAGQGLGAAMLSPQPLRSS